MALEEIASTGDTNALAKTNAAIREAKKIADKAEKSALADLQEEVAGKADFSMVEATNERLAKHADEVAALYPGAEERPGDARSLFTASISGSAKQLAAIAAGNIAYGANGAVLRVQGSGSPVIVATRQDFALEVGQTYGARWAASRSMNTSDPYGDAVEFRIAWLDNDKNYIATVLVDKRALTVADGRFAVQSTFSRDQDADITAPASARYARPYVRILGGDGVTDIEVIRRWESNGLPGGKGDIGREPQYFLDEEAEEIRWRQADGTLGPILDIGSARKKAEAAALLSQDWASNAAEITGRIPDYATVASLMSDTLLGYSESGKPLLAFEGLRIRADVYHYQVAAPTASDWHTQTAGGVNLYVVGAIPLADGPGVNIKAYGVATTNLPSVNRIRAQRALDTARVTIVTSGTYGVDASEGEFACLTLRRNINVIGPGGARYSGFQSVFTGTNTTASVFRLEITQAGGFGDVRNFKMEGMGFLAQGGRHGLEIVSQQVTPGVLPILTAQFSNCSFNVLSANIANDGYGLYLNKSTAHSSFELCTIQNGAYLHCFDNNNFYKCTSTGARAAWTIRSEVGVKNNSIRDCTSACQGGFIIIEDGDDWLFENNQAEQVGLNNNAVSAMVWVKGLTRKATGNKWVGCNLGGGTNVDHNFYIDNASFNHIVRNTIVAAGQIGKPYSDITFTEKSSYNFVGTDNKITETQASPRPDTLFPLVINDNGVGNINVPQSASRLGLVNGWAGGRHVKRADGVITFLSNFEGGATASGTVMGRMPDGFLPYVSADPVRRNILDYTEELANVLIWTAQGILPPARYSGSNLPPQFKAYKIVAAATGSATTLRAVSQSKPVANGDFCGKAYVSAAEYTRALLSDGSGGLAGALFDLVAGTVLGTYGPATGKVATIKDAIATHGPGWWEIGLKANKATGTNVRMSVVGVPTSGATVSASGALYQGDGVSGIYVQGLQLENASAPTETQSVQGAEYHTLTRRQTVPVLTEAGPGTITMDRFGTLRVGSLPANQNVTMPMIQGAQMRLA